MREFKFRAWNGKEMYTPIMADGYAYITADDLDGFYPSDHTVMQYTGLIDVNGVEIYENDVLSIQGVYQPLFVIEWGSFGWVLFDGNDGILQDEQDAFISGVKVAGNIHENPELMKGALK